MLHTYIHTYKKYIITCGRTLVQAAACCKMRLHVITLTEGPTQSRYKSDTANSTCESRMKEKYCTISVFF